MENEKCTSVMADHNGQKKKVVGMRTAVNAIKLIRLLHKGLSTKKQIATELDISERSVYRYINQLENYGFRVECNFASQFYITEGSCFLCGSQMAHDSTYTDDKLF